MTVAGFGCGLRFIQYTPELRKENMNSTTQRAIENLKHACMVAGIESPEVFPAEPVSSYEGSQVQIGTNTVNYFCRDDEPGRPWCLEITHEDGTYESHADINNACLWSMLRELVKASTEERTAIDGGAK